jgi:hypothetical protein
VHFAPDGGVTKEFADMMVKLAAAWGQTVTEARIIIYARALRDVPIQDVRRACGRAVSESEFFPSAAKLLGYVRPNADDGALIAWAAFEHAASAAGMYASVDVEDGAAALALTVAFGSWAEFCAHEDGPALAIKRQAFLAAYREARRAPQHPRRLVGLLPPPPPALAEHTFVARIAAGGLVTITRDAQLLPEAPPQHALPEARAPQPSEGSRAES